MSMIHISSLDDAKRVFGPLKTKLVLNHDTQIVYPRAYDDNDIIRWAGEEYWVETEEEESMESSSDDDDEWVMTAREVGAIVGVDKSVSCVSCSKVELLYTMVIQDSVSFEHWDSHILQLHKGIPPKGVYCTECYLNDYKPKKKEVETKTKFDIKVST